MHWSITKKKIIHIFTKIINSKPLNRNKIDLPIDPYILGYWLGDSTSAAGSVTAQNQIFGKLLNEDIESMGKKKNGRGDNCCEMRTIFNLRTELNKLNLLNNKHIPTMYLLSSYEQRLDLLKGIYGC